MNENEQRFYRFLRTLSGLELGKALTSGDFRNVLVEMFRSPAVPIFDFTAFTPMLRGGTRPEPYPGLPIYPRQNQVGVSSASCTTSSCMPNICPNCLPR